MRNQEGTFKQNTSKAHPISEFGPSTSVGAIQAQPTTYQSKAVAGGLARTAPSSAWPHLPQAVHSMHGEVSCMGALLKYLTKPTSSSYKRRPPLHIQHRNILGEEEQEHQLFSISF